MRRSRPPTTEAKPVRAHLLASLAAVRLDLGDDAAAFAFGAEALDLAGDDLALAIHATAAARLGNWESLRLAVRQVEAGIRPRGVFEIPRNRSRAAALAAAAAAHLAEHAEATDRAAACITRFGEFRAWPELVAAVADQAAERAIELLLPIALEDPGTDFARIAAVGLAPSTVGLLCLRWVEAREPATEVMVTGIAAAVIAGDAPTAEALAGRSGGLPTAAASMLVERTEKAGMAGATARIRAAVGGAFALISGAPPPTTPSATAVAAMVPPRRRVLDRSGLAGLTEALTDREALPVGDGPIEVLIAWPRLEDVVDDIARVHPSGLVVAWDGPGDDDPFAVGSAAQPVGDPIGSRMEQMGLVVTDERLPAIGRKPWGPEDVTAASEPTASDHILTVAAEEGVDADRLIALRLSLPMGVSPIPQHEDGRTDAPVLVLSPGIIPEPTWVQALWDNHLDHGVPVGARLANAGGRLLHAGADADGRPIGAGAPAGSSLFAAARRDLALLPPFIASADAIRQGPIRGLLVSDATAVTLEDGDPGSDAPASSWLHDALLVLDEAPPGEKAVAKLVALRAAGFTPILRWAHGDADPAAVRDLRGAGVITINPHEATPAGLAGALRPKVVVHLTESSMGTEQPVISATHPAALHLLAAPSQDRTLA